jgi:hypothetical protein
MNWVVKFPGIAAALVLVASSDCNAQQIGRAMAGIHLPVGIVGDSTPVHSPTPRDTFLGPDKVKHFFISAFIESVGFAGMEAAGANRSPSIVAATAVGAAAGIAREIHDKITKKLFSFGDLAWDGVGIASALLLISHTQR